MIFFIHAFQKTDNKFPKKKFTFCFVESSGTYGCFFNQDMRNKIYFPLYFDELFCCIYFRWF